MTLWLVVVTAAEVEIDGPTWTLRDVSSEVLLSADHPGREARWVPVEEFVDSWSELGFAVDPPNTSVSWTDGGRPLDDCG